MQIGASAFFSPLHNQTIVRNSSVAQTNPTNCWSVFIAGIYLKTNKTVSPQRSKFLVKPLPAGYRRWSIASDSSCCVDQTLEVLGGCLNLSLKRIEACFH
jgi:hypothetical protein